MTDQSMKQMIEGCCGKDGMPDFERIKEFMEKRGKQEFTDEEMKMMREFCDRQRQPDAEQIKQLMAKCGC